MVKDILNKINNIANTEKTTIDKRELISTVLTEYIMANNTINDYELKIKIAAIQKANGYNYEITLNDVVYNDLEDYLIKVFFLTSLNDLLLMAEDVLKLI